MQRAGQAVASLSRALAPHTRQVWIAAGPGNNGGDGLVAATLLKQAGLNVCVSFVTDPADLPPDARSAWERASRSGVRIVADPAPPHPLQPQDLAIDAVLGLGANRAPGPALRAVLAALSGVPCPVLAVDLPSGLNIDTGQPLGEWSVRATHTLSLLTLKPGLFTGSGRDHAGEVWFDDLGTDPQAARACADAWLQAAPASQAPPRRWHTQHKGSFGDVAVVGGSPGMAGGALLAARAAHAAGAGRVHVDLLQPDPPTLDGQRPELMFCHGWWRAQTPASLEPFTVVAGCGGGQAVGEALPPLLSHAPRLVLDADALNCIASDASLQALLVARAGKGCGTVLTPHPLEAARLLGDDTASAVQADRLAAATALAERFRCVVVLKGSGSVVASPGERPSINPTGNAALASAGTGDVLAGWLAGHWSAHRGTAREAAVQSVWWHGHAADTSTDRTQRAADLVDTLHALQRRR
jgi:hydroxyethylthiazole kinase-like uncharacterized protein yjeF